MIHLNFRLVKNQHIDDVMKSFDQRVKANMPEYVDYEIAIHDKAAPSKVKLTSKYHKKAEKILKALWDKEVFYKYS
jgi:acetylornithine deacetylase/succinyl-diaminopimelate desuccinylase-like protein